MDGLNCAASCSVISCEVFCTAHNWSVRFVRIERNHKTKSEGQITQWCISSLLSQLYLEEVTVALIHPSADLI